MILLGHRGARGEAPENTLPGFAYAKSLGLTAVEFDIHLTRDDQLVVIHDATVDRTTNGSGAVADLTLAEIQALDARSVQADWPEPCFVPTFEQVLEAVRDFDMLEIEIKKDSPERLDRVVPMVLAQLAASGYKGEATISSFEIYPLELVQKLAPEQPRAYIGAWDSPDFLETAIRLGATRACVNGKTGSAEIVRAAQDRGLSVNGWPCNSAEALATFQAWGTDIVCSDHPSTIKALLEQ
jgi:glycerophosphoryl diester phosphodiesterase